MRKTDSYKVSHHMFYPPGMTDMKVYFTARSTKKFKNFLYFGMTYFLYQLEETVVSDLDTAEKFWNKHLGPGVFKRELWQEVLDLGYLPVEIRSLPEGGIYPSGIPYFTIQNTKPGFHWLVGWLETQFVRLWYPITVATQSRYIHEKIMFYLKATGCKNPEETIPFMLHDFGYRGVSSEESAKIGGAAHLASGFMGTDTVAGIEMLMEYYSDGKDPDFMPGFSIPALEHSVVTSWGEEQECECFENAINAVENDAILAIVADSYDIERACKQYFATKLRDRIMLRDGTLVVRPDSGNPVQMAINVFEWLWNGNGEEDSGFGKFGTINSLGFRVLPPNLRIIYGDGINRFSIPEILQNAMQNDIAAENFVFGMGSGMLQDVRRDDGGFALKACYGVVNGRKIDIFKNPKSDPAKMSKKGDIETYLDVSQTPSLFVTATKTVADTNEYLESCMHTVYKDGVILVSPTFEEVVSERELGEGNELEIAA